ncbi:MAG: ATP-dependent DNA helicase [Lachnospiraceae bacterium]|nr:ATP-dependent DNA helicase [Lachnospiraceae bacterium]
MADTVRDADETGIRGEIRVSVRNLVEFILRSGDIDNRRKASPDADNMIEGARIHRLIQSRMGSDYHAEVMLREVFPYDAFDIVIEGRADGIIYKDDLTDVTIDEIKTTYKDVDRMEGPDPVHLAQAKCYAYIFAHQNRLEAITVRMTYVNRFDQKIVYFHDRYTYKEVRNWFFDLLSEYEKWAKREFEWIKTRNESVARLEFPFEYREGQKELMSQVYRTIIHKKKLFLEAPTGVGKTISTVFPSVKAMGMSHASRIFYLTAKTVTGSVARECFDILRSGGLKFKVVSITAKEKICPLEVTDCNPVACPYAKGHFDRVNEAIFDLLTGSDDHSRDMITEYALKHMVCPFEMGLDLSLFSDAVICDYNYVFDPNVYLRRFFGDTCENDNIFLVDEAHNLCDRAMDMYSADLYKEDIMHMKNLVRAVDNKSSRALDTVNRKMLLIKRETESIKVYDDIPELIMALNRAMARLDELLDDKDRFEGRDEILELYFKIRHFINMYDNIGDNDYVIYSELSEGGKLMVKLLCVNPSRSLKLRLLKARSTVFFSATLLPVKYYRDMLGADPDDYAVYANSVFDPDKRGLFIASDVSSKYTRRNDLEYDRIARYISDMISARRGNYMVFFPSHAFLSRIYEIFEERYMNGDTEIIRQRSSMSEEEREVFLAHFCAASPGETDLIPFDRKDTLVGFCVMGGIFAEGIDLKNDSLIGALIVGTGLPMVCNERELMKKCYDEQGLNGFDYAYRFPGMNKVMQAAGRVIRTIDDVGIVTLLDERFLTPPYRRLFPREWSNYEICSVDTALDKVSEFWEMFH